MPSQEEPSDPQGVWKIIQRASMVNEDSKDSNEDTSQMYSAVADLYHEFRPRYPKDLLDEAIQKSELLVSNGEKSRILEIGCGPGTLTLPLAQRGYQVVAVEPGSGMIAKAQEVCQDYSNVEFHRQSFKDYVQKEDVPFDAIIAATSLHWALAEVDQPALIQKMAGLLKDGGHLLLFWNFPPEPEDAVLDKVAEALGRPTPFYFGTWSLEEHLHSLQKQVLGPVETSGCFSEFEITAIPMDENISIERYIGFLETLSNYITMEDEERKSFFQIVRETLQRTCGEVVPTRRKSILHRSTKI